jgi:hypothetical protein
LNLTRVANDAACGKKMPANNKAIEIHVCFKDRLKNSTITVATDNVLEARRIARMWGEQAASEPITRTIVKREVTCPDREMQIIDGVTIWPPLF